MIAVIVPAHNEARLIGPCVRSVCTAARDEGLAGESVVIVVAADACTDATAALAARAGAIVVTLNSQCVGAARHCAAMHAIDLGARWIASTDADSRVPPGWLSGQLGHGHAAFCGTVSLGRSRFLSRRQRADYESAYSHRDGHAHVHGANLGISADLYARIGGFPLIATHEDVGLVDAVMRTGTAIARRAEPRVTTSARLHARAPDGFASFLAGTRLERERDSCPARTPLAPAPA